MILLLVYYILLEMVRAMKPGVLLISGDSRSTSSNNSLPPHEQALLLLSWGSYIMALGNVLFSGIKGIVAQYKK